MDEENIMDSPQAKEDTALAERERVSSAVPVAEAKRFRHTRSKDIQNIFKTCLWSPVSDGDVEEFDEETSLESMKTKNTTAISRIALVHTAKAMKGDPDSTKIVFKYAGLEPSKEVNVTLPPLLLYDIDEEPSEVVEAEYTVEDGPDLPVVDDPRLE